jgi:hypothetical protein
MLKAYKATKPAAFSDYNFCEVIYAVGAASDYHRYKAMRL